MAAASPSADAPDRGSSTVVAATVVVVLVAAASVWLRWPGLTQGGFASHDVAGILHEGMVLHDGGLPYVDTLDFKAPGTFWLAKWLAGADGTDIARFQIWAGVFSILSLLTVAATAGRLFGGGAAIAAAVLYGLHDLHLDSIDANYVTWAQTPMVLAAAAALIAPSQGSTRGRWTLWLLAGLLAGLATLCKRPAGVVAGFVVLAALMTPRGERRASLGAAVLGLSLSHLPIVVRYAAAGELTALWEGYFFNTSGVAYAVQGGPKSGLAGVREGVLATTHFVALPLTLAAFAAAAPATATQRRVASRLWIWAALAVLGAWIGFRFYKGYFLAVLPPLCILAAAPWGLLGARKSTLGRYLRVLALLPATVLVARQAMFVDQQRRDRERSHDEGGRAIADHIGPRCEPGDRIWVWGWHLWDVYALTGARSASRVFKDMGSITPPNDDTWRTPATRPTFVDGPAAAMLMEDLQAAPPVWIALGTTAPHRDFEALRAFLREHYRRDRRVRVGRVEFWYRNDRAEAELQRF